MKDERETERERERAKYCTYFHMPKPQVLK